MIVWRIQDNHGRGPFKPGFTGEWKGDTNLGLPPIYHELGIPAERMREFIPRNMHAGCAVASRDDLHRWFSRVERRRLGKFGYFIVEFEPTMILALTETQVLFAHRWPLASLTGERAA